MTWLVNQVNKLRDRISSLWNAAWNWAVSKARAAYNDAVAWASNRIGVISSTVWSLYSAAKTHATNLFNNVKSNIKYWYDRAVSAAQAIGNGVKAVAIALYNDGLGWAKYWIGQAVAGLNAIVQGVRDTVTALQKRILVWLVDTFNRAVATAQAIIDGAAAIINALIKQLAVGFENFKAGLGLNDPKLMRRLLQFLSNPGKFILAFMWDKFLEFMEWSLAYAIGSMDDPLPPLPNWFDGLSGGVIPSGTGPPPGASGLAPPLDKIRVSGYAFRQGHPGIDLGLWMGTPVYAMHYGVVEIAKWSTIGYGYYVTIRSDEWWTLYAHLEVINVSAGQVVGSGHIIGLGNSTGKSTGPHLHLEIKHRGSYIDPLTVL